METESERILADEAADAAWDAQVAADQARATETEFDRWAGDQAANHHDAVELDRYLSHHEARDVEDATRAQRGRSRDDDAHGR